MIEFGSKRFDNLRFSALRAGIGRPLGDADIAAAAKAAAAAETALVFVGRSGEWDTKGSDLDGITLPGRQDELVEAVLAANRHTIVVLQTGGPVASTWMRDAPAILQAWYPGQEAGNAIADVLFGAAEPGGRLPQTFPTRWQGNLSWSEDPQFIPARTAGFTMPRACLSATGTTIVTALRRCSPSVTGSATPPSPCQI
ncbi:glycoside hydrolase family 3 protein [Bradyrhizobium guangzhouense]|uniref:glycoside hydrolase family 3 protein n=1 Tax=Bradyrhizobium guangzhouense TaxID=1325095 RepID=UPI001FE1E217|nr:glycoside hydrolase family 3 C-terminal domain-containing protein [Bradyrhizobium guangzhouense]